MIEDMLDGKSVEKIFLIPYSHHDYAWVCPRNWHIARYVKCFHEVLEIMERDKNFTWCIDNVIHSWIPFAENAPKDAEKFAQLVRSGRIEVLNGGYSLARPSYVGEESYIRNMAYGRKFFSSIFGLENIPCLFNADTASGHSQMPQIAKLSGHEYYRFQRPDFLLSKKKIPFQFIWEGLDGSRILVTRGSYGNLWINNSWLDNNFDELWNETKNDFIKFCLTDKLFPEMPVKNVILFVGSDDSRPLRDLQDKPLKISEFTDAWNEREPVKIEYSTLSQVYEIIKKENLPVIKGVLDHSELSFNLPFKGNNSIWQMRIFLDRILIKLEKACLIAWTHGKEYPSEKISEMWFDLFEITGHAIEYVLKNDYINLYSIAQGAKLRAFKELESAQKFVVHSIPSSGDMQIVVFNYLNWQNTGLVECEVTSYQGIGGFDLVDNYGNITEYQIIDYYTGYTIPEKSDFVSVKIIFKATVPSMGYALYHANPNGQSLMSEIKEEFIDPLPSSVITEAPERLILDNGSIEVVFNKGSIEQIIKSVTKEKLEFISEKPLAKLVFKELPPQSSWLSEFRIIEEYEFEPKIWYLKQHGPLSKILFVSGKIAGNDATIEYSLLKGENSLGISVSTNFNEEKEGFIVFSMPIDDNSDIFADIPFGTEKREVFDDLHSFFNGSTKDVENLASAELELPGQIYARNWCSFTYSCVPVTFVTEDCSVYYNYNKSQATMELFLNRHMPLKYRTDRWVGQGSEWADGTGYNNFNFSIYLNKSNGISTDIQRYHKKKIFPLSANLSHKLPQNGEKPKNYSMFGNTPENIICTAAYLDNKNIIIRMFECNGDKTIVNLRLPEYVKSLRIIDFIGDNINSKINFYTFEDNKYANITFGKFQIITIEAVT